MLFQVTSSLEFDSLLSGLGIPLCSVPFSGAFLAQRVRRGGGACYFVVFDYILSLPFSKAYQKNK